LWACWLVGWTRDVAEHRGARPIPRQPRPATVIIALAAQMRQWQIYE
jgi:hypothetical protein